MKLGDVFTPGNYGIATLRGVNVLVTGYVIDKTEIVALALTESKSRCQAAIAVFDLGEEVQFTPSPRVRIMGRRVPGKGLYEMFAGDLPKSSAYAVVLLHRSAVTRYLADPPNPKDGPFKCYYVFSQAGSDRPQPIWADMLQQLVLVPMLSTWSDVIWDEAVRCGLATQVETVGGFTPTWRVEAADESWKALYQRLALTGQLETA